MYRPKVKASFQDMFYFVFVFSEAFRLYMVSAWQLKSNTLSSTTNRDLQYTAIYREGEFATLSDADVLVLVLKKVI